MRTHHNDNHRRPDNDNDAFAKGERGRVRRGERRAAIARKMESFAL
ncbi:hypothetical protein [Mangrovibrevibacter kandeliae]|nr:hypothetical protein [Aurantimonas sp. CSK15Z-1]MCQ8781696.1 hypothetical protein [Aurantimonas sp. CSK15Z-1]